MTEQIALIKVKEVVRRTLLSKPTLYRLIRKGHFPKQLRLSPNNVAWLKSEIDGWLSERAAAREVQ
jgi:prophage regulatory protein